MKVISNAMLDQVEIVQLNRWECGPVELIFLDNFPRPGPGHGEQLLTVTEWNRRFRGGYLRAGDSVEAVEKVVPALTRIHNPNIFLVPRVNGYTELHAMLASVVPTQTLERHGIAKIQANTWLTTHLSFFAEKDGQGIPVPGWIPKAVRAAGAYAGAACRAFEEFIWTKLANRSPQVRPRVCSRTILRCGLLAGDAQFWMGRLYRVALDRSDAFGEVEADKGLEAARRVASKRLHKRLPPEERANYFGAAAADGRLESWHSDDPEECVAVVDDDLPARRRPGIAVARPRSSERASCPGGLFRPLLLGQGGLSSEPSTTSGGRSR